MAGSDVVVAMEYCLTDVWAVLPDRIVERATVVVRDGVIASIVENGPTHGRPISGQGSVCIPGIVDLHSSAGLGADPQGITTQLHGIGFGAAVSDGDDLEAVLCTGSTPFHSDAPVEHRPLICLDLATGDPGSAFDAAAACVRACPGEVLVSISESRDGADGPTAAQAEHALTWFTIQAVAHRVRLVARHPVTADDVDRAVDWGAIAVESPVTVEAARRAHERGLRVLGAAPELLTRPAAPVGISPFALVELGLCDALTSGDRPSSMIDAVSLLVLRGVCDLRRAVALVTSAPADVAGLRDRGRLAVGLRGDLVLLRPEREHFRVGRVFRAGEPARARSLAG
jgi:alpha-D-ribose 1-methylphosphonate 5-triphosphate diphosphatase